MIRVDTFFGRFQVRVTKVMRWSGMATSSVPAEDTKLRLDIRKRSMMVLVEEVILVGVVISVGTINR